MHVFKHRCPVTTFRVYDDNKLMQTKQKIGTVLSTIVLPPYKAFKFPGVDKKNVYVRCTLLLCLEGETHCKVSIQHSKRKSTVYTMKYIINIHSQ